MVWGTTRGVFDRGMWGCVGLGIGIGIAVVMGADGSGGGGLGLDKLDMLLLLLALGLLGSMLLLLVGFACGFGGFPFVVFEEPFLGAFR